MENWSNHLDRILTMSGEELLVGSGNISHEQAIGKVTIEYKKYQERTLSDVEKAYLDTIRLINKTTTSNDDK